MSTLDLLIGTVIVAIVALTLALVMAFDRITDRAEQTFEYIATATGNASLSIADLKTSLAKSGERIADNSEKTGGDLRSMGYWDSIVLTALLILNGLFLSAMVLRSKMWQSMLEVIKKRTPRRRKTDGL